MTCPQPDGLTRLESSPVHSMLIVLEKLVARETPYSLLSEPFLVPSVQERRGETRNVSRQRSDLHCGRNSPWESSQNFSRLP